MTAGIFLGLNSTIALAENYEIEWKKCLGGSGEDLATWVQQTSDGGYIIAGNTNSSINSNTAVMIRT